MSANAEKVSAFIKLDTEMKYTKWKKVKTEGSFTFKK